MLLENSDCKMIELDCKQRPSADVSIHYTMRLRTLCSTADYSSGDEDECTKTLRGI